jgi:hypothetical protein
MTTFCEGVLGGGLALGFCFLFSIPFLACYSTFLLTVVFWSGSGFGSPSDWDWIGSDRYLGICLSIHLHREGVGTSNGLRRHDRQIMGFSNWDLEGREGTHSMVWHGRNPSIWMGLALDRAGLGEVLGSSLFFWAWVFLQFLFFASFPLRAIVHGSSVGGHGSGRGLGWTSGGTPYHGLSSRAGRPFGLPRAR